MRPQFEKKNVLGDRVKTVNYNKRRPLKSRISSFIFRSNGISIYQTRFIESSNLAVRFRPCEHESKHKLTVFLTFENTPEI